MEDVLTEEERANLRKIAALRKVAWGIFVKWNWLFILTFVYLTAFFSVYLVNRLSKSSQRFVATTRLLYTPRQVGKITPMGDKQLLRVLERRSLRRRVGEELPMPDGEKETLPIDLKIVQEGRPSNLYTLTAKSGSRMAAVRKVNAYADILLNEYSDYRVQELTRWIGAAGMRDEDFRKEIADLEAQEAVLKSESGTATPLEALTALNSLVSDQRRNLLMIDVETATETSKQEKYEDDLGDLGPSILGCSDELQPIKQSMESLDAEIAKLREMYTDLNPKVRGKLEDRALLEAEYISILEAHGVRGLTSEDISRVERSARGLMDSQVRLAALANSRETLQRSLRENEEKVEKLAMVAPQLERLRAQRMDLERARRELDEQLDEVGFVRETIRSDLQQIERTEDATDRNPLGLKTLLIAAAGAGVCTGALAVWTVMLGLLFGKMRGTVELGAYGDVEVLGSLPRRWALRKRAEKDALGVVALNFVNSKTPKNVVLVCRLKGAKPQPKFAATLDWSLSMAGQRPFLLNVVQNADFEAEEGAETLINTVKKGSEGWFPVVNRYSLAPTELQMLRADLEALRADFDCILVAMPGGLRRGGNFLSQLLGVCDSALLMAGADKTRRRELAYVKRMANLAGKPMMGLVTGAKGRVVRREMEASKW